MMRPPSVPPPSASASAAPAGEPQAAEGGAALAAAAAAALSFSSFFVRSSCCTREGAGQIIHYRVWVHSKFRSYKNWLVFNCCQKSFLLAKKKKKVF